MKTLSVLTMLCLFSVPAVASKSLKLTVIYGDKESTFILNKSEKGQMVSFFNSYGLKKEVRLSSENYTYIMSLISDLGSPQKQTKSCSRENVTLAGDSPSQKWEGCLGGRTPLAQKLTNIANTFTKLI